MTQSVITWSYRGVFLALVVGSFAGVNGCALLTEGCADTATCGTFDGDKGIIGDPGNGQAGNGACSNGQPGCDDSGGSLPLEDHYVLRVATYNANAKAPECADGTPADVLYAGPAGLPTCNQCTCTTDTSPSCDNQVPHKLECWNDLSQEWKSIIISGNQCLAPSALGDKDWCRVTAANQAKGGVCTPAPRGNQAVSEDPWLFEISACMVKEAKTLDEVGACTRHDGDVACKPGLRKTRVYKTFNDTRSCSGCSCAFQDCTSEFIVYDTNNCAGSSGTLPIVVSTIETDVSQLTRNQYSVQRLAPIPPADCSAIGGEPEGSVIPNDPVTFCCK